MVQFDWPATLIGSSIALLGICLGFSAVRAWLRRLWGGTPDVEQGPDNHSTELDDLARAILPAPTPPTSSTTSLPSLPLESIGPPLVPAAAAAQPPANRPSSSPASSASSPRRRSARTRRPPQYYGR
ncbi:hypothetical protein N7497_011222 [Penicillium chrysogenum]|nr:hypothetical protein N7497_011222 [Penicillium chrysogenum]